jgi:DNA mismatch endonuclease (patch repair protein)
MAAIHRRDTAFERQIRSLLHADGFRFRVDLPIRVGKERPIRPDIVFTRRQLAIFCDGCFWHGCPEHGRRPDIKNSEYWNPKLRGNQERDLRHRAILESAGWTVLRFWEHERPDDVVNSIRSTLALAEIRSAERSSANGRQQVIPVEPISRRVNQPVTVRPKFRVWSGLVGAGIPVWVGDCGLFLASGCSH